MTLALEVFGIMPRDFMERYGHYPSADFSEVLVYYRLKEAEANKKKMNKEMEGILPDDVGAFGKKEPTEE